jgi:hypothetical protein
VQVDDPWVPPIWPTFPSRREANAFDIDLPVDEVTGNASQLARYLAGVLDVDQLTTNLQDVVAVLEHLEELDPPRPTPEVRRELTGLLLSDPAAAVLALGRCGADEPVLAEIGCASGLVATSLPPAIELTAADELWTRWPALGALATLPWLDEPGTADAAMESLHHHLGAPAYNLLAGREERTLRLPQLDMPQLLEWDEALIDGVRGASGLVPKGLLHQDARAASGFQIIARLRDPETCHDLYRIAATATGSLNYLLTSVIEPAGLTHLATAVTRRIQGTGWQQLPAISLAYAACARLAPRAEDPMRIFGRRSRAELAAIAKVLPGLVAADLAAAELSIRGAAT